jgi:hypothetical protein
MSKCLFCGADLVEGLCPNIEQHFSKMCLNCASCDVVTFEDGTEKYLCVNETNMNNQLNKIKEALVGYEIEDIKLKPLPLKDETKKCKLWKLYGLKMSEELQKYI